MPKIGEMTNYGWLSFFNCKIFKNCQHCQKKLALGDYVCSKKHLKPSTIIKLINGVHRFLILNTSPLWPQWVSSQHFITSNDKKILCTVPNTMLVPANLNDLLLLPGPDPHLSTNHLTSKALLNITNIT
jgi:hypothetical protein